MSQVGEQNNHYIEEDEIDLRELWQSIKNGKKIIFAVVALVVSLTLVYALKQPNVYQSEMTLIPTQNESSLSGLGGLGGLAAMAGVSIGGGSMTPDVAFDALLNNYDFIKSFVVRHDIVAHYEDENLDKNYVFALGFRGIYDLLTFKSEEAEENQDMEAKIYNTVNMIVKNFSISSDKKTSLVTITYSDFDRNYPPEMINMFLKDASSYLVSNSLKNIDGKLKYFESEFARADSIEIRQSLSATISKILEQKVVLKSKEYYECDPLTTPSVAYIKDKTKPKRGLILVVSFVTSIILGIFFVFFLQFIRSEKSEEKAPII
ncbi:MAG: Wzz/FepE/Etk N-terminal domain-containing protein [Sulfurimonas sp.]|nr:Wzz/FepE/Etk N-terminal domain-containing protein [Sulfurimonas sp.]